MENIFFKKYDQIEDRVRNYKESQIREFVGLRDVSLV